MSATFGAAVLGIWWVVVGSRQKNKRWWALSPQPTLPSGAEPPISPLPWRQPFVYLGSRFLRIIFSQYLWWEGEPTSTQSNEPSGEKPPLGLPQGLDSDNLMLTLFIVNLWSILHVCALVDSWWSAQPQPVVLSTLRRGLTIYCFSAMVMVIIGIQIYWSKIYWNLDTRSQEIFYNPYDCWTHKKGLLSCNR